jgi:PAS domain S-box-containing protein
MLLSHVNDGVVGTDADSRITYWGKGAERMYGFSSSEAVGRTPFELLRPAYQPEERERILAEVDRRGSSVALLHLRHKDGAEVVAEVNSTKLVDERGRHTGYVIVYRDMTERYRAIQALRDANERLQVQTEELRTRERQLQVQSLELRAQAEELQRSDAELRGILNATKESIWEFSPDGRILMANDIALKRFGHTREKVVGRRGRDFYSQDLAEAREAKMRGVVESGQPIEFEDVRAGIVFEHRFYPIFGPGGNVSSIACFSRDVTARRRTERALRESEAEASTLIRYAPTGIYEIDYRGPKFIGVNDAMCRILGYSRQELLAMSPAELLDADSQARFADRIRRQIAGGTIEEVVEYRVRKKDGDFIWAILNVAVSPNAEEPHKVLVIAQDITERKRLEEARRRDRERFELLSVTAAKLLESRDPQTVVDEICSRIMAHLDCQLFFNFLVDRQAGKLRLNAWGGIPDAEARKLQWLDYGTAVCGYVAQNAVRFVAEDIPARPDPRTDLVAGFGVQAYACHPLMSRGEVLGTLSFGTRTRTQFSPEDLSMMKTVADEVAVAIERMRDQLTLHDRSLELQRLTEELETRVRERTSDLAAANERLKAEADQRARLVAAVEQADEGVVIMDAEGRIHDVNSAFLRLSGRGRDELLAISYPHLLACSTEGPDLWADMRVSIDRNETWRGHVTRRQDGGEPLELDVTLSPIHDDAGRIINYLAAERDVTREVRLQQHLRQIQKLEALGTLAGGIAHDFNNILNPIFISTELLLLERSIEPGSRHLLETTLKAAERGRDLVKQIIAFSRQKERERKPSKVGPVVTEAVKFLRVSLPSTIEIRSDIHDESGAVLGDQAQIHQIVMNLCNNAAYAMRERGGTLSIGLGDIDVDERLAAHVPALKPGPYLCLTVADTGTGMTPQVKERAFDPFFTTKKAGEGSGMGLAVVAGIVRDYGGAISFTSEEDLGSTFTIYLPRVAVEKPETPAAVEGLPRGSERVLLIDDEDVQVRSVRNMLTRLGYQVVAMTGGLEALALFKSDPQAFDLLITDQTMPQLTGTRICEEALGLRPDLPIILCTGYSETVDAAGARALGVREFLMKPYSIREMAETIRRALTGGRGEPVRPGRR